MREYFSHDFSARSDRKLVKLAMKHGMQGVGSFWCIVEMLFEEQGRIMLSECERIAFELRVDYTLIESLINDFELFQKDENSFWSESVNKRIELQILVSNGAKKAANTRWEKFKNQQNNANALQPQSEGIQSAMPEKKRKEKEIKETINNKQETNTYASLVFMFEEFRKKYPGTKRGADAEIESFKKKHKDWMKIIPLLIPCLENQIKVKKTMTDKNIFVPQWSHLQTFLNQRKWEEFQEVPADVNKFNLFGKEEKGVMKNVW